MTLGRGGRVVGWFVVGGLRLALRVRREGVAFGLVAMAFILSCS